jgi:putative ABC transport system permease protein
MPLDYPTYLRISKASGISESKQRIIEMTGNIVNEHYKSTGINIITNLQSLKDVHLRSNKFETALHQTGDHTTVVILTFLALFILLITISNFVNLITSRTENRLREIGMRQVTGATRQDILKQLIIESLLIAVLACFFALAFTELFSGPFSKIVGVKIWISVLDLFGLLFIFLVIAGITGILTGAVHYLYLSGFSPIQVLSIIRFRHEISWIKIGLVIVQFSMMIFLLSVFSVLYFQVRYMNHRNPGFKINQLIVFYEPFKRMVRDFETVRGDLLKSSCIIDATASEGIPGVATSVQNIWIDTDTIINGILINEHRVRDHYIHTFGIDIIEGQDLSSIKDSAGFLLNETAVRELGMKNPVGTIVNVDQSRFPVLGVVRDFHFKSLHNQVEPLVISKYITYYRYITLRVNEDSIKTAIDYADSVLKAQYPEDNFTHFLLAERYRSMYDDELKTSRLLSCGALLAILISMLGLAFPVRLSSNERKRSVSGRQMAGIAGILF